MVMNLVIFDEGRGKSDASIITGTKSQIEISVFKNNSEK
jgi:hypothetical protein